MPRRPKLSPVALQKFRQAKVHASRGDVDAAIECYRRALEIEPEFAEALANLGMLYSQAGDAQLDDAVRCLERSVELRPANARARYNLGVLLATDRARIDDAIRAFEETVALKPDHRNALYGLAVQWSRKGDLERATHYYDLYRGAMAPAPRARPAPRLRVRFVC